MSSNLHHTIRPRPARGWTICLPSNLLRMAVPAARRWRQSRRFSE